MSLALHAGWFARIFSNPDEILATLGVKRGYSVLEIGCGPGRYTFGASRIVGSAGKVYAFDDNPHAIQYLWDRLIKNDIPNVVAEQRNACDTGLHDSSIDFAFLFGAPRTSDAMPRLVAEIARVLKPGAVWVTKMRRGMLNDIRAELQGHGLERRDLFRRYQIFSKSETEFRDVTK